MVRFNVLELKGEYDFASSNSEYKTELMIGNAKVCENCKRGGQLAT
jgi:hypothetical protein